MTEEEIKAWCSKRGMTFLRWLNREKGTFEATNNEPYPTGGIAIPLQQPFDWEMLTSEEIQKRYPDKAK